MHVFFDLWCLLFFCVVASLLFFFYWGRRGGNAVFFSDFMDVSQHGQIIFDEKGRVYQMNTEAKNKLEAVFEDSLLALRRSDFFDYLYDNAVDTNVNIENIIDDANKTIRNADLTEFVNLHGAGLHLVEAKTLGRKGTLFNIVDINNVYHRQKDLVQLNQFNNHLIQAIQATKSGIVVSDPKAMENPFLFVNDAFCALFDKQRVEFFDKNWSVIINMIDDEDERQKLISALSHATDGDVSMSLIHDDKTSHFNIRVTPVYDKDNNLDLFVGIIADVTLLKQREAEVFQTQRLESLGKLAAGVAHDFNNILSIIGGYSVMASSLLDDEKVSGYLKRINEAAERGAGLTQKMLTFSKHKVVSKTITDLCDIVNEQKELLVPLIGASIDLNVVVPDHEVNVRSTDEALSQILMNFAVNARDAMPGGGMLSVEVSCLVDNQVPKFVRTKLSSQDYVCLSVSDTGTGMDKEVLAKIFDPFFSTKEHGKGTGLGLSVVYGLANEIGGVLDVSSEVGKGTTMFLYLPRCHEHQKKKVVSKQGDMSSICLDGFTALVAEDEPDLLHLVTTLLEEMGLNVLGAKDGAEALVMFDEYDDKVDVLLTDVLMPKMNGVKLAEMVSALSPNTQIIFMSGYPASGALAPVDLPDEAVFVAKPVDYQKLVRFIMSALQSNNATVSGMDSVPQWITPEHKDKSNDE